MKKRLAVLAAAVAGAPLMTAMAADRSWTGSGDGFSWNDPLNWDGGLAVPSDGDNLLFPDVISGQTIDTQANRLLGTSPSTPPTPTS
jgi:hypothetical protein